MVCSYVWGLVVKAFQVPFYSEFGSHIVRIIHSIANIIGMSKRRIGTEVCVCCCVHYVVDVHDVLYVYFCTARQCSM